MNRRGFFAGVAAAFFVAVLPPKQLPIRRGGSGFGSSGAFLEAKRREIDALYEQMADRLAIHMWGDR